MMVCSLCASAQGGRHVELPKQTAEDLIVEHSGFTLSYDITTHCPRWVAWELTAEELNGDVPRSKDFLPDPLIPTAHRVEGTDYRGSGYDRGHMCPAADMKWSVESMRECFYMSNMCPQDRTLNGVAWERLESACRRWANTEGSVYIVCGPIFYPDSAAVVIGPASRKIRVPDAFFKVVLSLRPGHEKAIGFIYRNDASRQAMGEVCCSVDEVEAITGYDFFSSIDDDLEAKVESNANLSIWR